MSLYLYFISFNKFYSFSFETDGGSKPTIYHTRDEHAGHYTTDVVLNITYNQMKEKFKDTKRVIGSRKSKDILWLRFLVLYV
jgi:hypothetical protein